MVFAESFLLELLGGLCHGHRCIHLRPCHGSAIGYAIQFTGDELEAALRKAVPLLLTTVTQPSRSAFYRHGRR